MKPNPREGSPTPAEPSHRLAEHHRSALNLIVPFAALWLLSLARVVSALREHRTFGVYDTLAVLALALLPWVFFARRSARRFI